MWLFHGDKESFHQYMTRCFEPVIEGFGFKTPGQADDEQKLPLSAFFALVLFGLGGVIPGLTSGVVGSMVGDWFTAQSLIVRIPAQIIVAAIIGLIAACIAGSVSGGIIGFGLTRIMSSPKTVPYSPLTPTVLQLRACAVGGGTGIWVGLFGGPICVFIEWPHALIVGGFFGPFLGLAFAFAARVHSQFGVMQLCRNRLARFRVAALGA